jgi:xanthine dehydrogenase small subunit
VLLKGEFIKSITIPKLVKGESFTVHKISRRYEDDISAVCMAIKLVNDGPNLKEAVIALGGMAEIPKRATMLEKTVTKYWNKRDIAKRSYESLKEDFCPLDDVRASSEYRLQVSANLIKKTLLNRINEKVPNLAEPIEN